MRVLRLADDEFLIDTEPASGDLILQHLGMYKIGRDAEVAPAPGDRSLLSLIGPLTPKLLGDAPLGPEHSHRRHLRRRRMRAWRSRPTPGADLLVPGRRRSTRSATG